MDALDPALPEDLARAAAHPDADRDASVRWIQTHISHVFLTPERAVKLRKAVKLPFVDFSTRAARNRDCLREVELNRRLSPDVYLGVAPVRRGAAGFELGPVREALAVDEPGTGDGGPPEHCVVMRRLPEGRDALSLLASGELGPPHLERVAAVLADFHATHGLGTPAPFAPEAWRERTLRPATANLDALAEAPPAGVAPETIAALDRATRERHAALADAFERRRREGRAVDGHGDLHLEHVWFEAGPERPLLVDCLEFDDALRRIDAASEVAFLAMDLRHQGRPDLAEAFLRAYARDADDFDLYAVVDWYASYRAAVRAKVASLEVADRAIDEAQHRDATERVHRYLGLARDCLAPRAPGDLVLLCGTVGSGKSTLAAGLAAALGAAAGGIVSSDRTRKRLAGLAPGERAAAPPDQGLYAPERTEAVYAALLERAAPIVGSGRVALLDASFSAVGPRREALAWARERSLRAWLVEAVCAEPVARERLAARARAGRDPSDAGPEQLAPSRARHVPPEEWPAERRLRVATDAPDAAEQIRAAARHIRAEGGGDDGTASGSRSHHGL